MAKPLYALFTHGVGTQKPGFSSDAQKHLAAGLSERGRILYGSEACWAPVLDEDEAVMLKEVSKRGSSNRPMQRLVVETLADALCWENRREAIFDVLDRAYCRLRAPGPVTVLAHSLGVVIALEYLRARPSIQLERFVSFGTNLQLFHLGVEGRFVAPPAVAKVPWLNAFSDTDMLGFPIRGFTHATDVEVNVGGLFTRWNGAAHLGYWTEKSLWRKTLPGLIA